VFEVSDKPFEFGLLTKAFEMWIDPEERPACESGIYTALQPLHCLVRIVQYGVNKRDLIVGVMIVAKGTSEIQRPAYTL